MSTTWDNVRPILESQWNLHHERGDQWRGSNPFQPGSDGNHFVIKIAPDGEHGTYISHKDGDKGSLYELAKHLGVEPTRAFKDVKTTKKGYGSLADYAEAHGATEADYIAARWSKEIKTIKGRPALEFQTDGGVRWRFIDGLHDSKHPSFLSQPGYKQCWYGLKRAVKKANDTGQALVFCNGEPSTVAGDKWGIPTTTITSGEKGEFPPALLEQLKATGYTGKIIIALDCDYTGMKAAFSLEKQFKALGLDATAIDLGLGESGDLGDFCILYGDTAKEQITKCKPLEARALPPEQMTLPINGKEALQIKVDDLYCSDIDSLGAYIAEIQGDVTPIAPPMINPFTFLHSQGGLGKIVPAGKLVYFASISGGTKTIGFETGWSACQDVGIHSIVYSPEWVDGQSQAVEFSARAVQREGGAHFDAWLSHRLAMAETAYNLPKPAGQSLTINQVALSVNYAANLMRKPGRIFYIKQPGLSAEQLAETVRLICEREAKNGIIIRALWCDFAQLLWLQNGNDGRIWIESAMNVLKDVVREKNLVGWINSQMRKDEAELAKMGGKIDASSMQFLSEQQCNLLLAFVPKYEDGKAVTVEDKHNPNNRIAILRGKVLKNSLAKPSDVEFDIPVDFSRLRWLMKTG